MISNCNDKSYDTQKNRIASHLHQFLPFSFSQEWSIHHFEKVTHGFLFLKNTECIL